MKYLLIVAMLAGTAWGAPDIGFLVVKDLQDCLDKSYQPRAKICMTDKMWFDFPELIAAAEGVLPYLTAPGEAHWGTPEMVYPVYRPFPSDIERAEKEVERLKVKDAAIKRFREALEKVK